MPDTRRVWLASLLLTLALLPRGSDAQDSPWVPLGPAPIPNGSTLGGVVNPVSGRVTAIAVHPTNPNLVYIGSAHGGVWRTTNGGTTWTPLMDGPIGSLALAPSSPDTLYVGTGEANFFYDCFFGDGLYRIDNAGSATPTVVGPFASDALGGNALRGRSIAAIQVHPTDAATVFVATVNGVAGIGATNAPLPPSRGLYRSTNATSASPTFARLTGLLGGADVIVRDLVLDPGDANRLIVNAAAFQVSLAGIYLSTNALAPSPTFTQTHSAASTELVTKFAIHRDESSPNATVYAAADRSMGSLLRSLDGGATWTQRIDNDFCSQFCSYSIAVAVDPGDVNRVYLGGYRELAFGISTDGGSSFAPSIAGLQVHTQAIAVARSNPAILYVANEGGIFRSNDFGSTWISLNNATLNIAEIWSLDVHPVDPEFTLASAVRNGTLLRRIDGTWWRGDLGFSWTALIDQSATNTNLTNMFHTFFGSSTTQGYAFLSEPGAAVDGAWNYRGCPFGPTFNDIACTGSNTVPLHSYPIERGPGLPNTIYFGNDRLYRSTNLGVNHTIVSQGPIVPQVNITAIDVANSSDAVRVVGFRFGQLYGTHTGATTLVNLDASGMVPDQRIADVEIDPVDLDTVYVALSAFDVASVWKTTNLSAGAGTTWQAAASGLPQAPVNSLLIHPIDRSILWAGTDTGVFITTNGGQTWSPFGNGLPRVPVFDLARAIDGRLRIATLGRGMWETDFELPDSDEDDLPDALDNCPYIFNTAQVDSGGVGPGPDGIGDACQCGDVDDDGIVTPSDLSPFRAALANPSGAPLSPSGIVKCNVIGAAGPCRITDVVVTARALESDPVTGASLPPGIAPVCAAATPP